MRSSSGRLAVAMLLGCASPAIAEPQAASSTTPIVVTGKMDELVRDYVAAVVKPATSDRIARFEKAVCPAAMGRPRGAGSTHAVAFDRGFHGVAGLPAAAGGGPQRGRGPAGGGHHLAQPQPAPGAGLSLICREIRLNSRAPKEARLGHPRTHRCRRHRVALAQFL